MKTLHIGLLWHTTAAGNLGVGALTVGNMAMARAAAARAGVALRFTIFGGIETAPPYVTGTDVQTRALTGRYVLSPSGYRADLKTIDVMLDIGAGDSFTDIYPDKRFAYIIATKALAIWSGTPLILSPQTIGPFSRQPHTALAAWACRRADAVFARDPMSMAVLREMVPGAKAAQSIDVAFALPYDTPLPADPGAPIRIGLNVSGLLMAGGYTGDNEFGLTIDYPQLTRQLIALFTAMPGVELHLVPHVVAPGYHRDDGAIADALKTEFPALHRNADFTSPSSAKSFIAGLDFLVGARMHATIAAYSAGVPVVPISYSRKFEGLFGGLGYPWLVPAKGMTTEQARDFIVDAFSRRDELKVDIARGAPIIAAGLEVYIAELTRQFTAAAT